MVNNYFKQLWDKVFVIFRIIKVEVGANYQPKPKAEGLTAKAEGLS